MQKIPVCFDDITSVENLLCAWREFLRGKRGKRDAQEFGLHLMDNVFSLRRDLVTKTYRHGGYEAFNISDPKPRNIHKATVRDRLLHHAIYRILAPHFNTRFIHDSYSCRLGKGTHKALRRFEQFSRKVSENNTKTCWVLRCDIKKFFASVDHVILFNILEKHIEDKGILWLLERIIESFSVEATPRELGRRRLGVLSRVSGVGLPLGNLTSQLLVNIYMYEFDFWMKQTIHMKHYIRYADDFVVFSQDREYLAELLPKIAVFIDENLKLTLHPDKVFLKTLASGVDFLGWAHFPDHRVLRTTTKRRMLKRVTDNPTSETVQSYIGLLSWGNAERLKQEISCFQ